MRKNSKINDNVLIGLAKVGITQTTMANLFECHQTAISAKMRKLNLTSFGSKELENIFFNLSAEEKDWYVSKVIKSSFSSFITELIQEQYKRDN